MPAAVAVLFALSAYFDWWSSSDEMLGAEITIRASLVSVQGCLGARCEVLPSPSGAWAILAILTLIAVGAAALVFGASAFYTATDRDGAPILRVGHRASSIALLLGVLTIADGMFEHSGVPSLGALFAGAAAVLGWFSSAVEKTADPYGAAASSTPVKIDKIDPAARALPRAAPAPVSIKTLADLRFVVKSGALVDGGLTVELTSGAHRTIVWADVTHAIVRRLPPDPPFEKIAFLDLVTAAGPLRLLPTSLIDYTKLPEGTAPTTKENWRRLVALAHDANPSLKIDRDSAPFFDGGDPPLFPAIKLFAEYDRRY